MDIVEEEVEEWWRWRWRRCYAMSDRLQVSPRQPDLASQQTKGRRLGCWLAWPGLVKVWCKLELELGLELVLASQSKPRTGRIFT